jgi:F420-dependent oxidoreductase-like protein
MMQDLGIEFAKPIRHLREYLSILGPLLAEGKVEYEGELLSCNARVFKKPEKPVPVLVAALGPQALRVTGRLADGTTLAWVGPKTIGEHIVPTISEAAAAAGKAAPRVLATLPLCVTSEPDKVLAAIDANLGSYGQLPSYKAMFEREGVASPSGVAVVGSRAEVEDHIGRIAQAGATDFAPTIFGLSPQEREDSMELLQKLV